MSFLDNSGDIILDAVLTDTGRFRMAKGNGSFKIVKFAFGAEEINYSLYEKNHTSGSAYYDLKILQTPILEAFTNNASTMHSKLISIPKTNLLFMPVMAHNSSKDGSKMVGSDTAVSGFNDMYVVMCDTKTENGVRTTALKNKNHGFLMGVRPGKSITGAEGSDADGDSDAHSRYIQIDQGLDTTKISQAFSIDPDLKENQYIVQIDNRLGRLVTGNGAPTPVNFIDDDNIATYYLSKNTSTGDYYVGEIAGGSSDWDGTTQSWVSTPIKGPVGTYVKFKVACSVSLNTSNHLFDTLGSTKALTVGTYSDTVKYIDSTIKVTGATTGYSVNIPVRFIKSNT